jgi:hypothetical protein
MNDLSATPPPQQPTQPFTSRSEHQAAVSTIIGGVKRELRIFDQHCRELGLNAPERFETLRQFLLASRAHRLYIVVHDTAYLASHCPRLTILMRQFSHAIFINKTRKELKGLSDNFIVADDQCFLKQFHHEHPRGVLGVEQPIETQALLMRFQEIWENSTPGLSATTLGL